MMMLESQRNTQVMNRLGPVAHFFTASTYARRVGELPGYFRISLTANDAMIEQALPVFTIALQKATQAGYDHFCAA
jgi:hypothetical protein